MWQSRSISSAWLLFSKYYSWFLCVSNDSNLELWKALKSLNIRHNDTQNFRCEVMLTSVLDHVVLILLFLKNFLTTQGSLFWFRGQTNTR